MDGRVDEVDLTVGAQAFPGSLQGAMKAAARPSRDGGKELAGEDHGVIPPGWDCCGYQPNELKNWNRVGKKPRILGVRLVTSEKQRLHFQPTIQPQQQLADIPRQPTSIIN